MERIKEIWPKWEGIEVLGEGGFGKVYKARKESFAGEEFCAIKIVKIPSNRSEADEMLSSGFTENNIKEYFHKSALNLVDEIKMMQKMKAASHIVSIEDYEVVENKEGVGYTIFIRMELLTNITKHFKDKEVTVQDIVKMATDILTALEFCHSQNIMHRDIKPANIFISEFGEYKLGDFGISKEVEKTNATLSQKGTKSYMAPEMVRMEKYGKNVDLYALGLTIYELLNHGRMPFLPPFPQTFYPQEREEAILKRLSGQPFPDIQGIGELNRIIRKACHPDKTQRYQTASEMKKDLLDLSLDNTTTTQLSFNDEKTNASTQALFSEPTQVATNEKTMGIFDQMPKPKNEFLFEDTITKPQPKPTPKPESKPQPKGEPKPTPQIKVEPKPAPQIKIEPKVEPLIKEKKSILSVIGEKFEDLVWTLNLLVSGLGNVIVALIVCALWFFGWTFSLFSMMNPYIVTGTDMPGMLIPLSVVVTYVLARIHCNRLEPSFKTGLILFGPYNLIVAVIACVHSDINPYLALQIMRETMTKPTPEWYPIFLFGLIYILPTILFACISPFKNRFYE